MVYNQHLSFLKRGFLYNLELNKSNKALFIGSLGLKEQTFPKKVLILQLPKDLPTIFKIIYCLIHIRAQKTEISLYFQHPTLLTQRKIGFSWQFWFNLAYQPDVEFARKYINHKFWYLAQDLENCNLCWLLEIFTKSFSISNIFRNYA